MSCVVLRCIVEIDGLVGSLLDANRAYLRALEKRELALVETCRSKSDAAENTWLAACESAEEVRKQLEFFIGQFQAARQRL